MNVQLLMKRLSLNTIRQVSQFHSGSIQFFNFNNSLLKDNANSERLAIYQKLKLKPIQEEQTNQWMEIEEGEVEDDDDIEPFEFDDHTTPAHHYLRQVRYVRKYMRQIKYEMPTFSEKVQAFVPPTPKQYLNFQAIRHLGENHDLDKKAVMIVHLDRLEASGEFTPQEVHFIKLICEKTYYPDTNLIRIGSHKYPTYNENKLWLAKTWKNLVQVVKSNEDKFNDVPLTKEKSVKFEYPQEWLPSNKESEPKAQPTN